MHENQPRDIKRLVCVRGGEGEKKRTYYNVIKYE